MLRWSFLCLFTLTMLACEQAGAQNTGVEQLYASNCLNCHGNRGQGGGAGTRTLLTDDLFKQEHDRRFFDAIKNGLPDSGMEAFGETLDDAQVWGLVGYIRELQHQAYRQRAGSPRPDGDGVYDSQHHRFRIERVIERGLDTPWAVAFLPDGRMLVADRPGELRIHSTGRAGGKLSSPITGTPKVRHRGQGGLMGIAIHPNHADNGWVYLSYSHSINNDAMTRIVRGNITEQNGRITWTNEQVIFEARPEHYQPTDLHYGCRIVFDPKDSSILFFAVGERGRANLAQDLSRPNGKIFRIRDDGSIPPGNPFADRGDAYAAIWSYGHRNPQGMVFDLDGNLWDTEHGPRGGDELNLIMPGRNYGWPLVSFGFNYNGRPLVSPWPERPSVATDSIDEGALVMPVLRWSPSIAVCGLAVGNGASLAQWKGDLFAGGLAGETVHRLRIKNNQVTEQEELIHGLGRVRDVVCGPDGSIYVALNGPDQVIRLTEAK